MEIAVTLTSLPFGFRIIPWLNACLAEDHELQVAEEVDTSWDEEDNAPLESVRLKILQKENQQSFLNRMLHFLRHR